MKSSKPIKTKTIRQTVTFKAAPHDVYEALMDSKKHSRFTGAKAVISRKVGGKISAFDGYVQGKNLVVADKKIVQLWRGEDPAWPANHFSVAAFALSKTAGGTKLLFTQSGVPAAVAADFATGWKEHYWQPMKEMLE